MNMILKSSLAIALLVGFYHPTMSMASQDSVNADSAVATDFYPGHPDHPGHPGYPGHPGHPGYPGGHHEHPGYPVHHGHYPWPHWHHGWNRPVYYWDWAHVAAITCISEDSYGDRFPVTEDGYFGYDYQRFLEDIEDAAIDRCYNETNGDEGCHLFECNAIYR